MEEIMKLEIDSSILVNGSVRSVTENSEKKSYLSNPRLGCSYLADIESVDESVEADDSDSLDSSPLSSSRSAPPDLSRDYSNGDGGQESQEEDVDVEYNLFASEQYKKNHNALLSPKTSTPVTVTGPLRRRDPSPKLNPQPHCSQEENGPELTTDDLPNNTNHDENEVSNSSEAEVVNSSEAEVGNSNSSDEVSNSSEADVGNSSEEAGNGEESFAEINKRPIPQRRYLKQVVQGCCCLLIGYGIYRMAKSNMAINIFNESRNHISKVRKALTP